jgi:squalene-hopene/tetraprenyl-beta-curcumene cyclase
MLCVPVALLRVITCAKSKSQFNRMITGESTIQSRLERNYRNACAALVAERNPDGFWPGELASSPLATATAISALSAVGGGAEQFSSLITNGLKWLLEQQRDDGGWGDTSASVSNISTTMLVRAAFEMAETTDWYRSPLERARLYIEAEGGAASMVKRYGEDRTFAVPILTNCALARQADWNDVDWLPFELACLPHQFFRFLRLHVVSYALPALIAIGQLIHARRANRNWLVRAVRNLAVGPALKKLESIQPESGGFLEAIPLTSFVTMSLAAAGRGNHPVVRQGVAFLQTTVRPDGSWPIDSNLSVWLTTLSVNALSEGDHPHLGLDWASTTRTRDWLLSQQLRSVHRYTHAAPGGWGWSHLSGSVPDADDTAGALLALARLPRDDSSVSAAQRGIHWLRSLQNTDGGWPTFCRGWGRLPFDRSGTDLTAHVLRALRAWVGPKEQTDPGSLGMSTAAVYILQRRALQYLARNQRSNGSWVPLWFGNQGVPGDENPNYGTCRVLMAYSALGELGGAEASRGIQWLLSCQNADGGWGGARGVPSTVEETGLAVEALAGAPSERVSGAIGGGVQWLMDRVESGDWRNASPIGLYFAKLWYFEKLYPLIFTVAALGRARRLWNPPKAPTS